MAIDLLTETIRSFAEAARRLPALRGGRYVSPTTIWRWTKRGVRDRHGVRVRLETIKLGGTCCTSDEALVRFFHALNDDTLQPQQTRVPSTTPPSSPDAIGTVSRGIPSRDETTKEPAA